MILAHSITFYILSAQLTRSQLQRQVEAKELTAELERSREEADVANVAAQLQT